MSSPWDGARPVVVDSWSLLQGYMAEAVQQGDAGLCGQVVLVRVRWEGWTRFSLEAVLVGTIRTELGLNRARGLPVGKLAPLRNATETSCLPS